MPQYIEVVVRETGSPWPDWLNTAAEGDRVVVSEEDTHADEPEGDLSFRVQKLLTRTTREGKAIRRAVVLFGTPPDNPLFDTRRRLSRALVSHLDRSPGSELVLVSRANPVAQEKLLALMGALNDLIAGTQIDISLRFCA